MKLQLYSDFVCPFCYLAEPIVARLVEETGVEVEHRAFELRPAPAPLADLSSGPYRAGFETTVEPIAAELGVEIRFPSRSARSRKAHEAARFARDRGLETEMRTALYRAYFRDDLDIGRIDVLTGIGVGVGLDATDLRIALDIDQYTDAVLEDEAEAARIGLSGVPSFRWGGEMRIGLQPLEELRDLVRVTGEK